MPAKTLMIQGSMSSAGKSLLVTALCRIFARQGIKVAPFKAQNMSNNAAVCADGSEIGRAQFTQALAARVTPAAIMNPILLKPEALTRSQVIVMGRPWQTVTASNYGERKQVLWGYVIAALDQLRGAYDLVIIEGAGSPVELNLKRGDIVNMAVARYAHAPVLLMGDIDRGGIFAQLLGTLMLLEPDERALVKGLIVNKFRGDMALFADGVGILEERGGVPVLGVIPHVRNLALPEEDAVALDQPTAAAITTAAVDIAVIHLPHIANFDDFDPLAAEAGVRVRYVSDADALGVPDAVILPGTKSTIADLLWLRERGLADAIKSLAAQGIPLVGICGGYQMLGQRIDDWQHVESDSDSVQGLGVLPIETTFESAKATYQINARVTGGQGWLAQISGQAFSGYEIHMGSTTSAQPWLEIGERNGNRVHQCDGAMSADGRVWGCYIHGLFANHNLRRAWLASLGWQGSSPTQTNLDDALERLADHVEAALDMKLLHEIIG